MDLAPVEDCLGADIPPVWPKPTAHRVPPHLSDGRDCTSGSESPLVNEPKLLFGQYGRCVRLSRAPRRAPGMGKAMASIRYAGRSLDGVRNREVEATRSAIWSKALTVVFETDPELVASVLPDHSNPRPLRPGFE